VTDEDEKTTFNWTDPKPGPAMNPDLADEFVRLRHGIEEWPSATLRPEDVPTPTATWSEICSFASHLNGYERYEFHALYEGALASADYFKQNGAIDPSLDLVQLRSWLWAENRAARYAGGPPSTDRVPYIRALVEAIRSGVEARAD
jgi:hypothetical protein